MQERQERRLSPTGGRRPRSHRYSLLKQRAAAVQQRATNAPAGSLAWPPLLLLLPAWLLLLPQFSPWNRIQLLLYLPLKNCVRLLMRQVLLQPESSTLMARRCQN